VKLAECRGAAPAIHHAVGRGRWMGRGIPWTIKTRAAGSGAPGPELHIAETSRRACLVDEEFLETGHLGREIAQISERRRSAPKRVWGCVIVVTFGSCREPSQDALLTCGGGKDFASNAVGQRAQRLQALAQSRALGRAWPFAQLFQRPTTSCDRVAAHPESHGARNAPTVTAINTDLWRSLLSYAQGRTRSTRPRANAVTPPFRSAIGLSDLAAS